MGDKTINEMIAGVIAIEGGFVNRADDKGGPTKYGVTIAALADYRRRTGFSAHTDADDIFGLRIPIATEIYKQDYYLTPKIDLLPVLLQPAVFDMAVNMGPRNAILIMQQIVHKMGLPLVCDGNIGPATVQSSKTACNVYGKEVLTQLCNARIAYYQAIVAHDPSQEVFLVGWIRRAESFLS